MKCCFRTLLRHEYAPPAVPQFFTPNTVSRKSGRPIRIASLTSTGRGAEIPTLLNDFWSTYGLRGKCGVALSLLRSGEVQFFNQLNLDRGDSATSGDSVCLLLNVDGQEQPAFAVIHHVFSVVLDTARTAGLKITGTVLPPCDFVVVRYFDNLADVKLKSSHKHLRALHRAQQERLSRNDCFVTREERLGHAYVERLGHAYVTFKSADCPPVYELVEAVSIVRRCRMWKDTSQVGPFSCFYADV